MQKKRRKGRQHEGGELTRVEAKKRGKEEEERKINHDDNKKPDHIDNKNIMSRSYFDNQETIALVAQRWWSDFVWSR
jgi:hypothetical protein